MKLIVLILAMVGMGSANAASLSGKDGCKVMLSEDKKSEKAKDQDDEMDALVDEIDEVLEENAEEFVKNYVQRGGQ